MRLFLLESNHFYCEKGFRQQVKNSTRFHDISFLLVHLSISSGMNSRGSYVAEGTNFLHDCYSNDVADFSYFSRAGELRIPRKGELQDGVRGYIKQTKVASLGGWMAGSM